jgi:hypothetical protein
MDRTRYVGVVQVALPSEGKGHTFESCRVRQYYQALLRIFRISNPVVSLWCH